MPRNRSSDLVSPCTSEPGESGCSRACLSRLLAGMECQVQSAPALPWGQRGAASAGAGQPLLASQPQGTTQARSQEPGASCPVVSSLQS